MLECGWSERGGLGRRSKGLGGGGGGRHRGHRVAREVGVRVAYKGEAIGYQRIDLLVDERLIVEAKSTRAIPLAAERQLLNYLRATNLEVGLLLHFGPVSKFFRLVTPVRASDPSVVTQPSPRPNQSGSFGSSGTPPLDPAPR